MNVALQGKICPRILHIYIDSLLNSAKSGNFLFACLFLVLFYLLVNHKRLYCEVQMKICKKEPGVLAVDTHVKVKCVCITKNMFMQYDLPFVT